MTIEELDKLLNLIRRICESSTSPPEVETAWNEMKHLVGTLPTRFCTSPQQTFIADGEPTPSRSRSFIRLPKTTGISLIKGPSESDSSNSASADAPTVLLIPISSLPEPIGLLAEDKVLQAAHQEKYRREENMTCNAKRTRFLLNADVESMGASSDHFDEAVSDEQASMTSSVEQMTNADMSALNDIFSDVDVVPISANVSGRGSPSVSGRDTPSSVPLEPNDNAYELSSQSTSGNSARPKVSSGSLDIQAIKEAAMEERFGKFGIPRPTREFHAKRDRSMHLSMDLLGRKLLSSLASAGIYCSAENANRLVSKRLHKKARMNCSCRNCAYPLTMIQRQFVPDDLVAWDKPFIDYEPIEYSSASAGSGGQVDPTTPSAELHFNALDGCIDRRSCTGSYTVLEGRPLNPAGRTGLSGRGTLRRWGPNHRVFLLFTRLNMVEVSYNLLQGDALEFTEFLSIRDESGNWCFPNVFADKPDFDVSHDFLQQLKLEIAEKSTSEEAERMIQKLKKHHVQVARSYYDDARNTDNAWVEVVAYEFGHRHNIGRFDFESDNNGMHLQWRHLEQSPLDYDSFR